MENSKYGDDLYLDLLERYKEVRKSNVRLLEEKRELLLRAQEAQRTEIELTKTNDICTRLKKKTNELEKLALGKEMAEKVNIMDNKSGSRNEEYIQLDSLDTVNECEAGATSSCACKSTAKMSEVIKINHQWQDAYSRLLERCRNFESNHQNQQEQITQEREENSRLRGLISKLTADLEKVARPEYKRSNSLKEAVCSSDDIEAMKHQLLAYQEDFHCERKEREKSDTKNKEYKLKIRQADEIIQTMSEENGKYKHSYNRVTQEKERILSELRRLSTSSLPMSPAYNPSLHRSQQRFSYPPITSEDIIPRQSKPTLHRIPSNAFRGGDVVRDAVSI